MSQVGNVVDVVTSIRFRRFNQKLLHPTGIYDQNRLELKLLSYFSREGTDVLDCGAKPYPLMNRKEQNKKSLLFFAM